MIKKFFSLLLIGMTLTVTTVGAQTFTCDPGWTLQGQTCTKPGDSRTETYVPTCNNGGNLQGGMCVKVTTGPQQTKPANVIPVVRPSPTPVPPVVAPKPPVVRFTCPNSSWTLNGAYCTTPPTQSWYAASCPNGGSLGSGPFCQSYDMRTRKYVTTNTIGQCTKGGSLSGGRCVVTTPGQSRPATRI
jgi:hypothetical protein